MRIGLALFALLLSALATPASAKGCLKGAVVGGVAGHYAGHHGAIGAAAGCLIGRHHAKKRARLEQRTRESDPRRIGPRRLGWHVDSPATGRSPRPPGSMRRPVRTPVR